MQRPDPLILPNLAAATIERLETFLGPLATVDRINYRVIRSCARDANGTRSVIKSRPPDSVFEVALDCPVQEAGSKEASTMSNAIRLIRFNHSFSSSSSTVINGLLTQRKMHTLLTRIPRDTAGLDANVD